MVVLIDSSTNASVEFDAIGEILNVLRAVFASSIKLSGVPWGGIR